MAESDSLITDLLIVMGNWNNNRGSLDLYLFLPLVRGTREGLVGDP